MQRLDEVSKNDEGTTKVRAYHFWVPMPGGKRSHRYVCCDPSGTLWGVFWSLQEVQAFCNGWLGVKLVTIKPTPMPKGATMVRRWFVWDHSVRLARYQEETRGN